MSHSSSRRAPEPSRQTDRRQRGTSLLIGNHVITRMNAFVAWWSVGFFTDRIGDQPDHALVEDIQPVMGLLVRRATCAADVDSPRRRRYARPRGDEILAVATDSRRFCDLRCRMKPLAPLSGNSGLILPHGTPDQPAIDATPENTSGRVHWAHNAMPPPIEIPAAISLAGRATPAALAAATAARR